MKRIYSFVLLCLMFTAITSWASHAITKNDLLLQEEVTFDWEIKRAVSIIKLDNLTDEQVRLLVRVVRGDAVELTCAGRSSIMQPGSGIICSLPPNTNLQLTARRYTYGAIGTYTILK